MPEIENKQFFSRNIRILFRQDAGLSLTTHARVLPCTAHDLRRLRLREIAGTAGITGRSTHSIATDLAEAGYVSQARRRPDQPPPNPGLPAAARTPPARNVPSGSYSTSSRARARTPPVKAVPPRPGPACEPPPTVTSPPPLRADWRPGSQVMAHCKLGRLAMGSERQHDFAIAVIVSDMQASA
jgi:hypothetical protein